MISQRKAFIQQTLKEWPPGTELDTGNQSHTASLFVPSRSQADVGDREREREGDSVTY